MIAVRTAEGSLVRSFPGLQSGQFGFHNLFGFISVEAERESLSRRRRKGLSNENAQWLCRFQVGSKVAPLEGCEIERASEAGEWKLRLASAEYRLAVREDASGLIPDARRLGEKAADWDARRQRIATGLALAAFLLLFFLMRSFSPSEKVAEKIEEPVTIKILEEKTVKVPKLAYEALEQPVPVQNVNQQVKRAVRQDLGFLGLIGRKDLKKALGGQPIELKQVSAGAGPGGTEGSGGEALVGLGEGVKRASVGNTGVQGLGGIGTKGRGGGAGGYGNSMVGSGEGKGLTSIPLSNELTLEGGLDRSVIQATIAKYLSQVRACYEQGLKSRPGESGQVSMAFEIGGSGRLNSSRVARSSLGDPGVEQCIATRMMSWQFPKPLGGVNVKVNYPFLLRPAGA